MTNLNLTSLPVLHLDPYMSLVNAMMEGRLLYVSTMAKRDSRSVLLAVEQHENDANLLAPLAELRFKLDQPAVGTDQSGHPLHAADDLIGPDGTLLERALRVAARFHHKLMNHLDDLHLTALSSDGTHRPESKLITLGELEQDGSVTVLADLIVVNSLLDKDAFYHPGEAPWSVANPDAKVVVYIEDRGCGQPSAVELGQIKRVPKASHVAGNGTTH